MVVIQNEIINSFGKIIFSLYKFKKFNFPFFIYIGEHCSVEDLAAAASLSRVVDRSDVSHGVPLILSLRH